MPIGYCPTRSHDADSALQYSSGVAWSSQRVPPKKFIGKAKASLYMRPTYMPKTPLSRMT